jgi:hypothetical protein
MPASSVAAVSRTCMRTMECQESWMGFCRGWWCDSRGHGRLCGWLSDGQGPKRPV